MSIKSAIYTGWIKHRRFVPVIHEFEYPIFLLYLDLDEIKPLFEKKWFCSLERFNVVSFYRKDFFRPDISDLKKSVIEYVSEEATLRGQKVPSVQHVRLLTHVRYAGVIFNPVSFYYCFNSDEQLEAIVAEITNTPWDEKFSYVLLVDQPSTAMRYERKGVNRHQFKFEKQFHVSPFNPMDMDYRWLFNEPGENVSVYMENKLQGDSSINFNETRKHFDATLKLERKSFSQNLAKTLIQYPLITVKVVIGIYWQAFKLWLKKAPFYDHPDENVHDHKASENTKVNVKSHTTTKTLQS